MASNPSEARSRHISLAIREAVSEASAFVCAWCRVELTEAHHNQEFSEGGAHSEQNLILLCPNCHSDFHRGVISRLELETRRSELSGRIERGSGNLQIGDWGITVWIGGCEFINCSVPLQVLDDEPLVRLERFGRSLLVSLRYSD